MIPSKSFLMAEDECKKLVHRGGARLVGSRWSLNRVTGFRVSSWSEPPRHKHWLPGTSFGRFKKAPIFSRSKQATTNNIGRCIHSSVRKYLQSVRMSRDRSCWGMLQPYEHFFGLPFMDMHGRYLRCIKAGLFVCYNTASRPLLILFLCFLNSAKSNPEHYESSSC